MVDAGKKGTVPVPERRNGRYKSSENREESEPAIGTSGYGRKWRGRGSLQGRSDARGQVR